MGEAKKRGTFKERQTLAMEKKAFEDMERRKAEIAREKAWAERRAAEDAERIARGEEPRPRVRPRIAIAAAVASAAAVALAEQKRRKS